MDRSPPASRLFMICHCHHSVEYVHHSVEYVCDIASLSRSCIVPSLIHRSCPVAIIVSVPIVMSMPWPRFARRRCHVSWPPPAALPPRSSLCFRLLSCCSCRVAMIVWAPIVRSHALAKVCPEAVSCLQATSFGCSPSTVFPVFRLLSCSSCRVAMIVWVPIVTSHALVASSVLFPGISFGRPSAAPPVMVLQMLSPVIHPLHVVWL